MFSKILVAVDGSEGSRKAITFAQSLAIGTGAHLTLLTVVEPPTIIPIVPFEGFVYSSYDPSPENLAASQRALTELVANLAKDQVSGRIEVGSAAETISRIAKEEAVDLLVVGARGLSVGERLLLGSVSDRLVHLCECPVVVVK